MVYTVELNWGKRLDHTSPPSPISRDVFYQLFCLYIYVRPHGNQIFEFTSFQTRVVSDHYEFGMAQCIGYQEILVKKLSSKHPESWTWLPA